MLQKRYIADPATSVLVVSVLVFASAAFAAGSRPSGAEASAEHASRGASSVSAAASSVALSSTATPAAGGANGCTASGCHEGIEAIRPAASGMMKRIREMGAKAGDPEGCVVCHGGNPAASDVASAHQGGAPRGSGPSQFVADPGSPWIAKETCGRCHAQHVSSQWNNLMATEAGKLQGAAWAFGSLTGYQARWGNYDASNPSDPHARLGTETYRRYMDELRKREPQVFPDKLQQVPRVPSDWKDVEKDPSKAVFTYVRSECQRCHTGVKGRQKRGDYRGMGCSSCHIPYGNEGLYEGGDRTIDRTEPGHMLVHSIQGSRDAKVTVHGTTYSGIPVETCTTCHDRGKRIGVSYQGLMESAFASPFSDGGKEQPKLHTKHYLAMQQDVHYRKGMLCQDCHTSQDVHGDGFLTGTNLAQVEIECTDCHGTPEKYPWELPLGFGEEAPGAPRDGSGQPRGTVKDLSAYVLAGKRYPPLDGYLLTTRGNPFGNVVRRGNQVIVHTAGGKDLQLRPLKDTFAHGGGGTRARVAMVQVRRHVQTMECYSCHASWAPQCYGCHVRVDYSQGKQAFDWIAAGSKHASGKHAADRGEAGYHTLLPGKVTESRSYMRWEYPMLVNDGEGRVSPGIPGCQVNATVVGPDGKAIVKSHIFRTKPGMEGGGKKGQITTDVSPVQPHTIDKHARSCESCHASEKALGYGIMGGRMNRDWAKRKVVDLETAEKKVLPKSARTQVERIDGLKGDWSRIVTEDGKQLMTVGHHWKRSGPLTNEQRSRMSREGVCLSCHEQIPERSAAISLLHHVARASGKIPHTPAEHHDLLRKVLLLSAWVQVLGAALFGMLVVGASWWGARRWKRRRDSGGNA